MPDARISRDFGTGSRLVVVTDGRRSADPAFLAAAFIAARVGADVFVLSVIEPFRNHGLSTQNANLREPLEQDMAARSVAVETQLALTVGSHAGWPITVSRGPLGSTVHDFVAAHDAQLVLIGQLSNTAYLSGAERRCGMRIIEQASVPTYVATTSLRHLPRCVVIGIDFSEASIRAIRVIARFCATDASLYLVHVIPRSMQRIAVANGFNVDQRRQVLADLAESAERSFGVQARSVVLFGRPGVELVRFAAGIRADIITCGGDSSHRSPIGRVAYTLLTSADCSILFVPDGLASLAEKK